MRKERWVSGSSLNARTWQSPLGPMLGANRVMQYGVNV